MMLFKRELKRNLNGVIITSLVCATLAAYLIAMSQSFGKDIQQILDLKLPPQFQAAFGMKGLDYAKSNGTFALGFSYIYLFVSIYMASLFAIIVSKEFSEKTAEFLFSLPAKRTQIIFTKLSVAFLYGIICIVVIFISSWLAFALIIKENYELLSVFLMSLAWLIGGFTFGAVSFLISSFNTKTRTVSTLSIGMVLGMFMLQVVISVNKNLDFLKYISPFDWFKGADIANNKELSMTYCIIALLITSISLFIGVKRFSKMDVLV